MCDLGVFSGPVSHPTTDALPSTSGYVSTRALAERLMGIPDIPYGGGFLPRLPRGAIPQRLRHVHSSKTVSPSRSAIVRATLITR